MTQQEQDGLGASSADAADRVTDAPHEAGKPSSPSGSVPTGAGIARLRAAFAAANAKVLDPNRLTDSVTLGASTVFALLDAAGQFLTFGAGAVRRTALEDAAQIADAYAATTPDVNRSDNHMVSKVVASVMSETGASIAEGIRALATPNNGSDQ